MNPWTGAGGATAGSLAQLRVDALAGKVQQAARLAGSYRRWERCGNDRIYIYIYICIYIYIYSVYNIEEIWVYYNDLTDLPHWK